MLWAGMLVVVEKDLKKAHVLIKEQQQRQQARSLGSETVDGDTAAAQL